MPVKIEFLREVNKRATGVNIKQTYAVGGSSSTGLYFDYLGKRKKSRFIDELTDFLKTISKNIKVSFNQIKIHSTGKEKVVTIGRPMIIKKENIKAIKRLIVTELF